MQFGMIAWYIPLSLYPAGYGLIPKCRCHLWRSHRRIKSNYEEEIMHKTIPNYISFLSRAS